MSPKYMQNELLLDYRLRAVLVLLQPGVRMWEHVFVSTSLCSMYLLMAACCVCVLVFVFVCACVISN